VTSGTVGGLRAPLVVHASADTAARALVWRATECLVAESPHIEARYNLGLAAGFNRHMAGASGRVSAESLSRAATVLVDAGVLEVNSEESFNPPSESRGPVRVNCQRLMAQPGYMREVVSSILAGAPVDWRDVDVLAAIGHRALTVTVYLAERQSKPMVFVRTRPKSHGKMKQIEGTIGSGSRALIVVDTLSTDDELLTGLQVVKTAGGRVIGSVALVDCRNREAREELSMTGPGVWALCDIETLIKRSSDRQRIADQPGRETSVRLRGPQGRRRSRPISSERTTQDSRAVAESLLRIGAVEINLRHPFQFSSGVYSPIYTDNRLLVSHPPEWNLVTNALETVIRERIGTSEIDVLAGAPISGIPHAARIAERLNLPLVYPSPQGDSSQSATGIEGVFPPGSRALIIEDLVTTGASVLKTAEELRRHHAEVASCVSIFAYNLDLSRAALARSGIGLEATCDLPVLVDVAVQAERLRPEERAEVLEWAEDPKRWSTSRHHPLLP
jgi:orotate phosphoribosyltransferase